MAPDATHHESDSELLSDKVKLLVNKPDIHQSWETTYRTEANERFFEQAYDDIVGVIRQPQDSLALDIGCGICANSVRLARRGYRVNAADYSESILEPAQQNVEQKGLADRIDIRREDILNLSFPDNRFDLVLCWGVLMHIPKIERAISELTRVAKPGGYIVIEEINAHAPEALLMRGYWRLLKGKKIHAKKTSAGVEHQCEFNGETLFWRHTNRRWLVEEFGRHSCKLVACRSGQVTEFYQFLPGKPLKSLAHTWNGFWLRYINLPRLAYHNISIFQKT
jgi:2-polyprenyl-3-methyl-5-hydroxy-6-metoxy-1,4-benzoquinol methylase